MASESLSPEASTESHFPVRIRISQPRNRFARQLNEMHRWLHLRCGLQNFSQWQDPDADVLFYFQDITVARDFVAHFDCADLIQVQGAPPP
jgi:hypothetical protein